MKTRAKSLFHLLVSTMLLVGLMSSCGKENESGGNSNNIGTYGTVAGTGGGSVPSNWFKTLQNEYRCQTGYSQRSRTTMNLNGAVNVNAGAIHVGVTVEGDLAVISRSSNNIILEVYACQRGGMNMNQQPQLYQAPIVNQSNSCVIGEVSAMNVYLNSTYGTYTLAFFPIGMHAPSSLCQ